MTFTLTELNTIRHCLECQIGDYEKFAKESKRGGDMEGIWLRSAKDIQAVLNKLNAAEF